MKKIFKMRSLARVGLIKMLIGMLMLLFFCLSPLLAAPCGDVNSSGGVDIIDALMTAQYYVGLNPVGFDSSAADVSGDGTINIVDALQLAQLYVGLIDTLAGCSLPIVTPAPTPVVGEIKYELQAETEATWDDASVDSNNAGFTGSGFVNSANSSGRWIQWEINAASATNALCEFRYACASEARAMELNVNGVVTTLAFPASGAWTTWVIEDAIVSLKAGVNTIRLTSTASGGAPNIDKMDITLNGALVTPTASPTRGPTFTPGPTREPGTGGYLPQDGNPVHARYNLYKDFASKADNILSYQLDCGGWPKNQSYDSSGSGGSDNGTFDNGATTMEMTVMADAYKRTGNSKYLNSARKAMDYIFEAQYPEGGWAQFYPLRGGYSDHVTFNDNAMSRIVTLLQHILDRTAPFDTDVITDSQRSKLQGAIDKAVDYILKAQYIQNGVKSVWCAQHGKSDYKPKGARAYEHPSLSGSESIEIIGFLMTQPQTPEISEAILAAVNWFRSPNTWLADYAYENDKFIPRTGSRLWYRFHDLATNEPIFSNYDGVIWIGLEYESKKKSGYRWAGTWGEIIINYANSVGY